MDNIHMIQVNMRYSVHIPYLNQKSLQVEKVNNPHFSSIMNVIDMTLQNHPSPACFISIFLYDDVWFALMSIYVRKKEKTLSSETT